jgi:hypothetical protein
MLAADGRCKTLDAAADGYVRAEAVGVLLLQSGGGGADTAQQPLALLAGSAVNQDGRSSGLTAPNGPAQQEVLRAALESAGLAPSDVAGISMHGTGTGLGDPIEVGALAAVFGSSNKRGRRAHSTEAEAAIRAAPLALLSSKSALGHAEPAAGVVGLLHAQLALLHGAALPITHLRALNPLVSEAAASGGRWCLPRDACGQPMPRAGGSAEGSVIGTSAFAYQVWWGGGRGKGGVQIGRGDGSGAFAWQPARACHAPVGQPCSLAAAYIKPPQGPSFQSGPAVPHARPAPNDRALMHTCCC